MTESQSSTKTLAGVASILSILAVLRVLASAGRSGLLSDLGGGDTPPDEATLTQRLAEVEAKLQTLESRIAELEPGDAGIEPIAD